MSRQASLVLHRFISGECGAVWRGNALHLLKEYAHNNVQALLDLFLKALAEGGANNRERVAELINSLFSTTEAVFRAFPCRYKDGYDWEEARLALNAILCSAFSPSEEQIKSLCRQYLSNGNPSFGEADRFVSAIAKTSQDPVSLAKFLVAQVLSDRLLSDSAALTCLQLMQQLVAPTADACDVLVECYLERRNVPVRLLLIEMLRGNIGTGEDGGFERRALDLFMHPTAKGILSVLPKPEAALFYREAPSAAIQTHIELCLCALQRLDVQGEPDVAAAMQFIIESPTWQWIWNKSSTRHAAACLVDDVGWKKPEPPEATLYRMDPADLDEAMENLLGSIDCNHEHIVGSPSCCADCYCD